jgi:UDP:flavonoid glycosyltransferase YjiC (YdhE family)
MICNGGAPATYAALAQGKPMLGLFHNLDQALNMRVVEEIGAGLASAALARHRSHFRDLIDRLLNDAELRASVARASRQVPNAAHYVDQIAAWIGRLSGRIASHRASKPFTNGVRHEQRAAHVRS